MSSGQECSVIGVDLSNLTLRSHCPIPPDQVERYVGIDCGIALDDPTRYARFVSASGAATDDPHVVSITVEPRRVVRF